MSEVGGGRIPIQNIYYLLIYGWDQLAEGGLVDISGVDSTELVDLYAAVLSNGIRHIARRGLDQKYKEVQAELRAIRGRVDVAASVARMLPVSGRAACRYDELDVDTLENRILVATLRRLEKSPALDSGLRVQLSKLRLSLGSITEIRLSKLDFKRVQLHSNNGFYRFLINVCELIYETSLSTEESGELRFRDFVRDQSRMARLFEKFVFNFYRRELRHEEVTRERIRWVAGSVDDPTLAFLPTMQTDISIRRNGRTLIIDAKYYSQTLQSNFGVDTVHSANLYQMFSYLSNLGARGGADASAQGMLLYPTIDQKLRLTYNLSGRVINICTVDLSRSWREIRQELLDLVTTSEVAGCIGMAGSGRSDHPSG